MLYTDTYGMPTSYRMMDGFGVHAFRLVNNKGNVIFAKFHWKSQLGLHGMTLEQTKIADTNYATRDLYDNIKRGNFPKWDLYVQTLAAEKVAKLNYDGFDDTKIWPGVPEFKVGTMTLNKVPDNYFEYTEESAFCPCVMVPGIEPSPDRMLQGRLFAYADTQRYRVGPNYLELPVNRPLVQVNNNNIDGAMQFVERQGDVNFEPTSASGHPTEQNAFRYSQYLVAGMTQQKAIDKQDNFEQAGAFYRSLSKHEQDDLIKNLAADLGKVTNKQIKNVMVSHFYSADKNYGTGLAAAIGADINAVEKITNGN
jgi:catalase